MIGALADVLSNWRRSQEDRRWLSDIKRNRERLRKNTVRLLKEIDMDDTSRKDHPVATGVIDYFPDALLAVASVSMEGARKHGTFNDVGRPTWDRSKSTDDADALMRHFLHRGQFDIDGHRHSAKVAWRALAVLQRELDAEESAAIGGYSRADLTAKAEEALKSWDGSLKQNRKQSLFIGVDPAKPGSDKTARWWFLAENGQYRPISEEEALARVSGQEDPTPPPPTLSEAEEFGMWLTTRSKCVHVGAHHPVYEMIDALESWKSLKRDAWTSRKRDQAADAAKNAAMADEWNKRRAPVNDTVKRSG